jgi:hypothetical protein
MNVFSAAVVCSAALCCCLHAAPAPQSKLVPFGPGGKLTYGAYTERGDLLLDFSNCGYQGGGVALPEVPAKVTLAPGVGGDDTARLQAALDQLAALPADAAGWRGAVLLKRGRYIVGGTLHLTASGVVLRGEGAGAEGTVLFAAGTGPRTLIEVGGKEGARADAKKRTLIADSYVPVGARSFRVKDPAGFKVGDGVNIGRVGNAAWIHRIGMDAIKPRASDPGSTKQWGPFTLEFDRVITAIVGDRITVDAPLACAIEAEWGGGWIARLNDRRLEKIGVEFLRGESAFNAAVTAQFSKKTYCSDEQHAETLVALKNVKHAWVRGVTGVHFSHSTVHVGGGAKWVTVLDCDTLAQVSQIEGGRRYPYTLGGQLTLVLHCHARTGRHAFALGARIPGPNAFVECVAAEEYASSEPHHRWSVGGLFDNVAANIAIQDRQAMGSGHGWAGANYVAWNCRGSLVCQQPPTAQNFAIGCVGARSEGVYKRPAGWWESHGQNVAPQSLYFQQLQDRLGPVAVAAVRAQSPRIPAE